MIYWLGQGIGLVGTATCIVSPLMKKKWQMTVLNMLTNFCMMLNLICLNEIGSGIYLFLVAIGQGFFSLYHDRKGSSPGIGEKLLFLALYLGLGFYGLLNAPGYVPGFHYDNLLEMMPIAGSVLSMCFLFAPNELLARRFILATASVWTVYTALILSTSFFAEFFTVVSTLIAIRKYEKQPAAQV